MRIEERLKRINEFCYNPYVELENITPFESLYVNSIRDFGRDMSIVDGNYFKFDNKAVSFDELRDKRHFIMWTGGKESFLTSKILNFFGIKYEKITFLEKHRSGAFNAGTESYVNNGKLNSDFVKSSTLIDDVATNSWGASVPILYSYVLRILQEYPGSVVWIGSEYMSCFAQYRLKFTLDQSDIMFADINNDPDIDGSVYSCVNSLREFDIYRISRTEFNYDPKFSFYDQGKDKEYRIHIWDSYMRLLDKINLSNEKELIYMELNYIPLGVSLFKPPIYDFRIDIAKFLRSLSNFDRYSEKVG